MTGIFIRGLRSPNCMVTKSTQFFPSLVLQDPSRKYSKQIIQRAVQKSLLSTAVVLKRDADEDLRSIIQKACEAKDI
eukprot:15343988-Ditylum_brightwellii.AAC.1